MRLKNATGPAVPLTVALALSCVATTQRSEAGPFDPGPNLRGTLILAENSGTIYTSDDEPFCLTGGISHCSDAGVETDSREPVVLSVIGAFNEMINPRVTGVTFGWNYDPDHLTIAASGNCAEFELPTSEWPGPLEGVAVTWSAPQLGTLLDVYWVAAYNYYGTPGALQLTEHPNQGGFFADDSIPAVLDEIVGYGSFGFGTSGELPCPPNTILGACCYGIDVCEIATESDCNSGGGQFQGWGSTCDEPCVIFSTGSCCLPDGECRWVGNAEDCDLQGGEFRLDVGCDEVPCDVVPVIESSWGTIKRKFR